jgi:hypothetical protein
LAIKYTMRIATASSRWKNPAIDSQDGFDQSSDTRGRFGMPD